MKVKFKTQILISSLVCLAPIILALILWGKLPDELPIHFNASGEADNYASKAVACFGLPSLMLLLNLIVGFGISSDPKKENANPVIVSVALWLCPVLSLILMPITMYKGMGYDIPIAIIVQALIGLLFIVIGNYLPKSRQSYTVGIRLPWTLADEDNWNKTHRFAGFIWVPGGFLMLVCSFISSGVYIMLASMLLLSLLPIVYSYILYRKKTKFKE